MNRILDIAFKDLLQLLRDFETFLFLLIMPIAFTFLFGFAFGGFGGGEQDSRLPVGYLNLDKSWVTDSLHDLLGGSDLVRLDEGGDHTQAQLEEMVADGDLAAAIIVPEGYGKLVLRNRTARLTVIADKGAPAWTTVEAELLRITGRVDGAVRTASILDSIDPERMPLRYAYEQDLAAWEDPPIAVEETVSPAVKKSGGNGALAHTAPGMMLQFAIAGLLTAAQIIVSERKSRTLQRILTTATRRVHILFGHYLAMLALIFSQFVILIAFGQFILKVDYLRVPSGTLLVAGAAALCISAFGLLIGAMARTNEQAVIFSLVPMFLFAGLGGVWVPLDVTSPTFQAIGHLSPVAWAMDGFENIAARGLGFESVLVPSAALFAYAAVFFLLAAWELNTTEEK